MLPGRRAVRSSRYRCSWRPRIYFRPPISLRYTRPTIFVRVTISTLSRVRSVFKKKKTAGFVLSYRQYESCRYDVFFVSDNCEQYAFRTDTFHHTGPHGPSVKRTLGVLDVMSASCRRGIIIVRPCAYRRGTKNVRIARATRSVNTTAVTNSARSPKPYPKFATR